MAYKQFFSILVLVLLIFPSVSAEKQKEEKKYGIIDIGKFIKDIGDYVVENIFGFILKIFNAPLQALLFLVKKLLSEPVNLGLFSKIWGVMLYVISMFYGLLFVYAGFNFIVSGHDVVKRENAKSWLKNLLIMIILLQASFFIYELLIELSSSLTAWVLSLIDNNFFVLTTDNLSNIAMEIFFSIPYAVVLFITVILLGIRYVVIAAGVILFPIAIFLYFFPVVRSYGSSILNFLGTNIFITFFASIIILVTSKLTEISVLGNFKMLFMTTAFTLVCLVIIYALFFSLLKAAFSLAGGLMFKVALMKRLGGVSRTSAAASSLPASQTTLTRFSK